MKFMTMTALLLLAMAAGNLLTTNSALAHSFNAVLVIPASNAEPVKARQIRDGFMLATTERDSHSGQESDGHLGGLDVYVTVLDGGKNIAADIERITARDGIDIVVAFGPEELFPLLTKLLGRKKFALLLPGRSPFSKSDVPAVVAFKSAYKNKFGARPSSLAARGYNAARRIDAAVRAQGGVDATDLLHQRFKKTARDFDW